MAKIENKRIRKRSMKNFTTEKCLSILDSKQWNMEVSETMNVDGLANIFNKNIEESLNEIAPY